jgi:hypothetical protein
MANLLRPVLNIRLRNHQIFETYSPILVLTKPAGELYLLPNSGSCFSSCMTALHSHLEKSSIMFKLPLPIYKGKEKTAWLRNHYMWNKYPWPTYNVNYGLDQFFFPEWKWKEASFACIVQASHSQPASWSYTAELWWITVHTNHNFFYFPHGTNLSPETEFSTKPNLSLDPMF